MFNIMKKKSDKQIKEFILKNYFDSRSQKKAILQAARKSAEDQDKLLNRYRQLVKKTPASVQ
jgi:hypothetical protein